MRGRTNALPSYPNPPIVEALSELWERNREALRLSDRPLSGNHGRAFVARRLGTVKNPRNAPPRTRRGNCWLATEVVRCAGERRHEPMAPRSAPVGSRAPLGGHGRDGELLCG